MSSGTDIAIAAHSSESPAYWSEATVVRWRPAKYEWWRKEENTASHLTKTTKNKEQARHRETTVVTLLPCPLEQDCPYAGREALVGGWSLGPVEEEVANAPANVSLLVLPGSGDNRKENVLDVPIRASQFGSCYLLICTSNAVQCRVICADRSTLTPH